MNEKGFSLVELLVAMAIASVLGMAGVALFSSSNWMYKRNEDVSEAQQNVRVAMEALSKDIRTAGFGLDDPPAELNFDGNTFTAPITVTNSSTGPDSITILGIGYEAGLLGQGGDIDCNGNTDSYICLCRYNSSDAGGCPNDYEEPDSFFSDSGTYQPTRRYISLNGVNFYELSSDAGDHTRSTTTTDATHPTKMKLSGTTTFDKDYADGTPVYIIQAVKYFIKTDDASASPPCTPTSPCLRSQDYTGLRGGGTQTIAESIEDLQLAYGIDVSPLDGKIDYTGSYTAANFVNNPANPLSIIAVRANVVAMTRNVDVKGGKFRKQCVEDRSTDTTYCTNATPDGYRRRLLTKIIKLRNPRSGGE